MRKFILIIFFKMSFVSAQIENKAPVSNKIEKTAELLIKKSEKNLSETPKQKIYHNFQPLQKLLNYIKNNSQNLNINSADNNKYKNQKTSQTEKNLSIGLESSFSIIHNDLLEKNTSWKYSIPYIDTNINYEFSKNMFFEMSFDFSYIENKWNYSIEEVFIQYKWFKFQPTYLTMGYFEYPVLNFKASDHIFSKKTLLEKNLFPSKHSDIGAVLKTNFLESFYLQLSLQTFIGERELLFPLNTTKTTFTASLSFEQDFQQIFASYLKQNFFSKNEKSAFGLGYNLFYPFYSLSFSLKGELWKINLWPQNTLTYYMLPSIQWKQWVLSVFVGQAYYQLGRQMSESLEYILKADFYLTDELFVSIERIKESDTIVKDSSWALSLKSHFNF